MITVTAESWEDLLEQLPPGIHETVEQAKADREHNEGLRAISALRASAMSYLPTMGAEPPEVLAPEPEEGFTIPRHWYDRTKWWAAAPPGQRREAMLDYARRTGHRIEFHYSGGSTPGAKRTVVVIEHEGGRGTLRGYDVDRHVHRSFDMEKASALQLVVPA